MRILDKANQYTNDTKIIPVNWDKLSGTNIFVLLLLIVLLFNSINKS